MAKRRNMRVLLERGAGIVAGPQAEMVIVDEIARMRYQQSVFDTMMLGLRLGDRPRILTATPRITPFMEKLVTMDDVRITTGSTDDNAEHLSANFLKKLRELYEGTRLGRSGATRRDDPRPHARAVQGRLADP